ncbi:MAG: polysaccharide biosynthesis tyrosine autokinase [Bacteroidota bacterium]
MKNNLEIYDDFDSLAQTSSGVSAISLKRVINLAIRFWYLIIISGLLGFLSAYLINRYSTRIYTVKASIIIKENQENTEAQLLYNNNIVNPYRNFYNEVHVLKSYPLIQNVIESLNMMITFHREGNIKNSELYGNIPLTVSLLSKGDNIWDKSLLLNQFNEKEFGLDYFEDQSNELPAKKRYEYGDTIQISGESMTVIKSSDKSFNNNIKIKFSNPYLLAKAYSSKLNISWREQGSSVLDLGLSGPVPNKEIDFLNRFIEVYQEYDLEKKNQRAEKSVKFLEDQLLQIGDSLKYYESQIQRFNENNLSIDISEEAGRLYSKIQELESQLLEMRLKESYFEYLKEFLDKNDIGEAIITPSSVGISDPVIVELITQLINLISSVPEEGKTELFAQNPLYKDLERRMNLTKASILKTISNYSQTSEINRKFATEQMKVVKQELKKLPGIRQNLVDIERNYRLRENLYTYIQQKKAEASISRATATSDIAVINPPARLGGAIKPNVSQNYVIGSFAGILLPILIFILIELLNTRVQSKEDIESTVGFPVICGIGHDNSKDNLVAFNKPKSAIAESFRSLRSNLNYFTEGKDKKIFVITSSIAGEGKTFTTINLGTVLAFSEKRVLIVGADMRRPKIFDDFGLKNEFGLSQYLSGMNNLKEVIQETRINNLHLISGGVIPPNPSELLLTERCKKMIPNLLESYDYLIIDTPPVGLVTDAYVLSEKADHTLFLVRQGITPTEVLKYSEEEFKRRNITNLSILLNDIKKVGLGYGYGNNYGYGGQYGKDKYSYGYYS